MWLLPYRQTHWQLINMAYVFQDSAMFYNSYPSLTLTTPRVSKQSTWIWQALDLLVIGFQLQIYGFFLTDRRMGSWFTWHIYFKILQCFIIQRFCNDQIIKKKDALLERNLPLLKVKYLFSGGLHPYFFAFNVGDGFHSLGKFVWSSWMYQKEIEKRVVIEKREGYIYPLGS